MKTSNFGRLQQAFNIKINVNLFLEGKYKDMIDKFSKFYDTTTQIKRYFLLDIFVLLSFMGNLLVLFFLILSKN